MHAVLVVIFVRLLYGSSSPALAADPRVIIIVRIDVVFSRDLESNLASSAVISRSSMRLFDHLAFHIAFGDSYLAPIPRVRRCVPGMSLHLKTTHVRLYQAHPEVNEPQRTSPT